MGLFDKFKRKNKNVKNSKINSTNKIIKNNNNHKKLKIKAEIVSNNDEKIPINKSDEIILEKIKRNESIANDFRYGDVEDKERAIKIYEANVAYGVYCNSYSELFYLYEEKREYDKAIDIIKKEMDFFIEEYGEAPERLVNNLKMVENRKFLVLFAQNNQKAMEFEEQEKFEEAIKLYKENINLNADTPYSYSALARIYHWQKEFLLEKNVLELAVSKFKQDSHVNEGYKSGFEYQLENVEFYLINGRFKRDCLPSDPKSVYNNIKKAKEMLLENKEVGCKQLEEIIEKGTYNNTAYYTLYKTYKKDKQYDDAIRICQKAIEVLGVFSQDRVEKYKKYMEKIPTYQPKNELDKDFESKVKKIKSNKNLQKAKYSPGTKFCMKCNCEMKIDENICPKCHYDFINNYYTFEDKSYLKNPLFSNIDKKDLTIKNIDLPQISSSKKAKFAFNLKELFVEEVAIEYYKQKGYEGIWSENEYWAMIYALLFWEIIFMPTDTCVQVPMNHKDFEKYYNFLDSKMMDMPQDMFKPSFYIQRKDAIEKRVSELLNNDITQILRESYYEHYGQRCRPIYDWDKYSIEELTIPLKLLQNEQIILIMDRMLHDYAYCRSGLPDVIVFNDDELIFVEVKSKKDTLSNNQIEWHEYLLNNVKVKVILFTLNKTERQLKNLSKKYEKVLKKEYTLKLSFDLNNYSIDDMNLLSGEKLINKQKDNELFAKELETVGKLDEAIKLYESNVNTNVNSKESYNKLANFYADKKDYDNAIRICKIGLRNVTAIKDQNFLRRRMETFENNKRFNQKQNRNITENKTLKSSFNKKTFDMYCIYCGTGLSKDSNFCHNCGNKIDW